MTAGDILFHTDFVFNDGETGKKLLILLNDPDIDNDESYLLIRTTSRMKNKILKPGCIPGWRLFYIPSQQNEFFSKDTLLQLDDIYELTAVTAVRDGIDKRLVHTGSLSKEIFAQLRNCIKQIKDDVSEKHYVLIFKKN